jgi:fluoroquinolone transport system ATP-binding protein
VISVQDVTFAYPDGKLAVDGINFSVEPGEIFGFLGPSGAGKSTTQKILIGLLKGYEGGISVLGKDLNDWGPDYYEHIGVSFELPNHYQKLTALENLNFFRSLYRAETEEPMDLLRMVGLADESDTRVSRFSKGMQMRLTFVRALLNRPELIFLDEPTAGLDPVNGRRMREVILDLKREGRTIFLTTHDMTVADQLCDRVAFIVDGQIPLIDAPRELKIREGERKVRVEYREDNQIENRDFSLDGIAVDEDFLKLLRSKRIETIHTEEATLEDVFIGTTGRKLI